MPIQALQDKVDLFRKPSVFDRYFNPAPQPKKAAKSDAQRPSLQFTIKVVNLPVEPTENNSLLVRKFFSKEGLKIASRSAESAGMYEVTLKNIPLTERNNFIEADQETLPVLNQSYTQLGHKSLACYDRIKAAEDISKKGSPLRQCLEGDDVVKIKREILSAHVAYRELAAQAAQASDYFSYRGTKLKDGEEDVMLTKAIHDFPDIAARALYEETGQKMLHADLIKNLPSRLAEKLKNQFEDEARAEIAEENKSWGSWLSNLFSTTDGLVADRTQQKQKVFKDAVAAQSKQIWKDLEYDPTDRDSFYIAAKDK